MRPLPLVILIVLSACSVHPGFRQRRFQYAGPDKQIIRMWVPYDYAREGFYLEPTGGTTQYYSFRGGAVFYVSWKVPQPVFNAMNIRRAYPDSGAVLPEVMQGIDASSQYWKEARLGDLTVGYLNVPMPRRDDFDRSVQLVRVRKRHSVTFFPPDP